VIKSSATNDIIIRIPRGLYGFKTSINKPARSIRVLASRMRFESENTLRIINKHGLDTVLQLHYDKPEDPVEIISVVKIDHFDEFCEEDHAMLDQNLTSEENTLARLVRTNQKFKVKMYHLKQALIDKYRKKGKPD
jgi:hypothetical protein